MIGYIPMIVDCIPTAVAFTFILGAPVLIHPFAQLCKDSLARCDGMGWPSQRQAASIWCPSTKGYTVSGQKMEIIANLKSCFAPFSWKQVRRCLQTTNRPSNQQTYQPTNWPNWPSNPTNKPTNKPTYQVLDQPGTVHAHAPCPSLIPKAQSALLHVQWAHQLHFHIHLPIKLWMDAFPEPWSHCKSNSGSGTCWFLEN